MHDITGRLFIDDGLRHVLPPRWTAELQSDGTVLIVGKSDDASRQYIPDGYVTVSESLRNFALGLSPPHCKKDYQGRGWRTRLYTDAVRALQAALEPVSISVDIIDTTALLHEERAAKRRELVLDALQESRKALSGDENR